MSAAATAPLLAVEGATKRYPVRGRGLRRAEVTVLDGVDVTVDEGETLGVVGESGSGKSTLGRAIMRLIDLDGGRILFEGRQVQGLGDAAFRPYRARTQMVFQNPATSFNPMMTIEDALLDAMRLLRDRSLADKRRRAAALLDEVELDTRFLALYPHEMSGGQLQRVAVARALAPSPKLVFLDEPTAALDMSIRGQVVNKLRELQHRQRLGFVLVSHDLRTVRYVADRVVVMYMGQIVESAPKPALFAAPAHPYTRALLAATRIGDADAAAHALKGELAGTAPALGCRLAGRCPHALARCTREPQPLRPLGTDRLVRCWRAEELAAQPLPANDPPEDIP